MKIISFDELFPHGYPLSITTLPDLTGKYMPFTNEGEPAPSLGLDAKIGGMTGCPRCQHWVSITLQQKEGAMIRCPCGEDFQLV